MTSKDDAQPTPLPWSICPVDWIDCKSAIIVGGKTDKERRIIAFIGGQDGYTRQDRADARVLAAAHGLLLAAEDALLLLRKDGDTYRNLQYYVNAARDGFAEEPPIPLSDETTEKES